MSAAASTASTASTAAANTAAPDRSRVRVSEWPSIPGRLPLTEASVRRTVGTADPAVRNLWITQSYADLARRLLDVLRTDQTWCTFAIWASFTAGQSIRGEELPHIVTRVLPDVDDHLDAVLGIVHDSTSRLRRFGLAERLDRSHLERLVARAVEQVSVSIADGNTLVFSELAPTFVRFVEGIGRDGAPAERDVESWLDAHGVPAGSAEPLVRCAFRHYALAAATDARDRAQHVLMANVAAVLHEQERLQTDIEAALDTGLVDLGDDLAGTFHRFVPARIRERIVSEVRARAGTHLEHVWRHVATRLLMTLTTPHGVLHLGDDVPPLADGTMFPNDLARPDLPELDQLLSEWDTTRGTGIGSGARDWADLRQRMTYIVNLFRSRQQVLDLTVPPFTTGQLAWMVRGEVPPNL